MARTKLLLLLGALVAAIAAPLAAQSYSEGFTFLTVASDMTHLEAAAAAHFASADRQRSATGTP